MPFRTVLLRLMLWSLGLAAGTGVLAVLLQGGDLVWRIVGTGLATALACGLMIPTAAMVDRREVRWAGLLGMGTVVAEFLLALILIWNAARAILPWVRDPDLKLILSMVFTGLAVGVAMACALPLRVPRQAIAAKTAIGFTVVTLAAFLTATWADDFLIAGDEDWWESAGALLVFAVLVVPSLFDLTPSTRRPWRWLGILCAAVSSVMWLSEIWNPIGSKLGVVVYAGLVTLSAVTAHANLCLGTVSLKLGQRWVRSSTIAAFGAAGLATFLYVWDQQFSGSLLPLDSDLLERFLAAAGIAAGCGTLALFVLARINRHVDVDPGSEAIDEITVICPRCRKKQTLAVGDSACGACGLRISIKLEEPRCAHCDYLLHGLTSDRCPECGHEIAPSAPVRV